MNELAEANKPSHISLFLMLETVLAFSIVFAAALLFRHVFHWEIWVFMLLAVFYPLKIVLSILAHSHRLTALAVYSVLLATFVALCMSQDWNNDRISWLSRFVFGPLALFTIPTVSFVYDLSLLRQHGLRFVVWRSVVEIIVITPPVGIVATIAMFLMMDLFQV